MIRRLRGGRLRLRAAGPHPGSRSRHPATASWARPPMRSEALERIPAARPRPGHPRPRHAGDGRPAGPPRPAALEPEAPGADALGAHPRGRGGHGRGAAGRRGGLHRQVPLQPDGPGGPSAARWWRRWRPAPVGPRPPQRARARRAPLRARSAAVALRALRHRAPPPAGRRRSSASWSGSPPTFPSRSSSCSTCPLDSPGRSPTGSDALCRLDVGEAVEGERLTPGRVRIAPAGRRTCGSPRQPRAGALGGARRARATCPAST